MSTLLDTAGPTQRLTSPRRLQVACLLLLLVLLPVSLSNHPASTALGLASVLFVFFFGGYVLLSAVNGLPVSLRLVLSPVVGMLSLTTIFDIFVRASLTRYFFCLAFALSVAGITAFTFWMRRNSPIWDEEDYRTVLAGGIVALSVAPLYWTGGRFSGDQFVFHGPAGQDPLFHVTLVQRLLHHVPPDNFMFSGVKPSVYHYFNDQSQALILRALDIVRLHTDLFDLYYRCFPTLLYFVLGALAYVVGRQVVQTFKGGILAILLLLGAGGLGPIIGILVSAAHLAHFVAFRERLMTPWTSWDGIDALRPLVHRPAHYMGLLVSLAAVSLLLVPARTRRNWAMAGLLLGLLAGFNFTLAATFGAAAVFGSLLSLTRRKREDAVDLARLAAFIFIGSLPMNTAMLFSGFHNSARGFPFSGPNLDLSMSTWGLSLGRILPTALVPFASLILLPIMAYGIKLVGIGPLIRLDLGQERYRSIANLFAVAFVISFVVGTFFPYKGAEVGSIFLQPTFCMLGLFALTPLAMWMERNRTNRGGIALCAVLVTIWVQALAAFNFSSRLTFDQDTTRALLDLHSTAMADDVVAYLPNNIIQKAIWGYPVETTNFAITALTGLDGYFSSEPYSILSAVPGLDGRTASDIRDTAERIYNERLTDVGCFMKGGTTDAAFARLASDHVRWIVISGRAMRDITTSTRPWRKTNEIAIYKLGP